MLLCGTLSVLPGDPVRTPPIYSRLTFFPFSFFSPFWNCLATPLHASTVSTTPDEPLCFLIHPPPAHSVRLANSFHNGLEKTRPNFYPCQPVQTLFLCPNSRFSANLSKTLLRRLLFPHIRCMPRAVHAVPHTSCFETDTQIRKIRPGAFTLSPS